MTILEHVGELRRRLIRTLVVLVLATGAGVVVAPTLLRVETASSAKSRPSRLRVYTVSVPAVLPLQ
jgi:Sec-independent protein secretion pathway component TatC